MENGEKVLKEKKPHQIPVQRYDIRRSPDLTAPFELKYWKPTNTPVLNSENEVEYIIHKVVDVTQERENEERFTTIFNQTSVGIALADLSGKFTLVNDRYCQIVGWSNEELYRKTLYDITYPSDLLSPGLCLHHSRQPKRKSMAIIMAMFYFP